MIKSNKNNWNHGKQSTESNGIFEKYDADKDSLALLNQKILHELNNEKCVEVLKLSKKQLYWFHPLLYVKKVLIIFIFQLAFSKG